MWSVASWLARFPYALLSLVRDLAGTVRSKDDDPAQVDDVLDVWLDDDGIDATGL